MNFRNFFSKLSRLLSKSRFPYEPLITIEISRSRLLHNLAEFRKIAPVGGSIAPVLKSNAYGHGLFEIANILETAEKASIPFFVIDSYFEAIALRTKGIQTPLLIIGYTRTDTIVRSHLKNIAFTITSLDALQELHDVVSKTKSARPIHIHLKIDTGMHRQGILPAEIDQAVEIIQKAAAAHDASRTIVLEGICSHLSDADGSDASFTKTQISQWNNIAQKFKTAFPLIQYIHLSNTAGHQFSADIEANVSRLGIGLYGLLDNPVFSDSSKAPLLPIMEMKTILTSIKQIKKNETVGYGNTFGAPSDMTIATIPVGYFEGIDRRLSNIGSVLVGADRISCPIVGRVSMNITTIDVSVLQNPRREITVVVFSNKSTDPNSVLSIAKKCNTISYEIAVHIPAHLKRVVVA